MYRANARGALGCGRLLCLNRFLRSRLNHASAGGTLGSCGFLLCRNSFFLNRFNIAGARGALGYCGFLLCRNRFFRFNRFNFGAFSFLLHEISSFLIWYLLKSYCTCPNAWVRWTGCRLCFSSEEQISKNIYHIGMLPVKEFFS